MTSSISSSTTIPTIPSNNDEKSKEPVAQYKKKMKGITIQTTDFYKKMDSRFSCSSSSNSDSRITNLLTNLNPLPPTDWQGYIQFEPKFEFKFPTSSHFSAFALPHTNEIAVRYYNSEHLITIPKGKATIEINPYNQTVIIIFSDGTKKIYTSYIS